MLYDVRVEQKEKPSNTYIFGIRLLLTLGVEILGKKISFDVRGFFQSNLFALEKTIEQICKDLSGKNVLDMYAGCGTFSVFLADIFEKVTLVEHNRDAIVFAEQNLQGTNHESFGLSGEKWIQTNLLQILMQ
jgi:23S rRNA (uracil1939-C5)-methyltransferase